MPGANLRQPRLVGRAAELASLAEVITSARHQGRIALVEGEAGIGKTRLLEGAVEIARDAGMTVLSSRAEELEAHRPFGAIVDCVGRDRLADYLDTPELPPDMEGDRTFRIAERLLEMLDLWCTRGSVLVIVEDLQWADPSTLAVLDRVATGIERLPVALVLSGRPEPRRLELERLVARLERRGAPVVPLGPLDEQATVELLRGLLGSEPGPRLLEQMWRAGGNPLFICELVGGLLVDGAIARADGSAELAAEAAAPTLPLTILHRLSFLPSEVLDVLGLASVLGATFSASDLALLAGQPLVELVPALRSARRAGVLDERGERLAFRHELVRDALYHDMPLAVRRGLHRELARALADAGEPIDRRVEHLVRAAAPGDEQAIASLIEAGRELVRGAPSTAVDVYRSAIELSVFPDVRRIELLPELAEALVAAGQLSDGEAACREALHRDLDAAWSARLRLRLMFVLLRQARTVEAIREGEAGLDDPRISGSDRERLQALRAMARVFSGEAAAAGHAADAVLASSDDGLARALAINTIAMAAGGRGAFTEAAELITVNERWAEETVAGGAYDARPHLIRGTMLVYLDRFDEALTTIQRGRRRAERLGLAEALAVLHWQVGFIDFVRGRLDDALAELAVHSELAEETAVGWQVPARSVGAIIAVHRDDLLSAERLVAAAEREAAAGAPPHGTDLMALARSRVQEATGDLSGGLDTVADAFQAAAASGAMMLIPNIGPALARLAAAAGQPERASGVVDAMERVARLNPGVRSLEARALQVRGLLESDGEALSTAVELLRGTGRALETARAAEDAADLAGGRAGELLEEAREIYERCGATRDVARVDAALRRRGVRRGVPGRRRRPATGWDALTDTERNVVRLVAERLTNPEIAERLFISRRTVQTHVSHALAKLGVGSRRELAAEAGRQAGWLLRVDDQAGRA